MITFQKPTHRYESGQTGIRSLPCADDPGLSVKHVAGLEQWTPSVISSSGRLQQFRKDRFQSLVMQ